MNEERTLEVEIEPGVRDGMEYPFIGEGMYMGSAQLVACFFALIRGWSSWRCESGSALL